MHPSFPNDQRRLYADLAWTWPIISPPEDYVEEVERLCGVLRRHARREVRTLLDLGCGGGHYDHTLKKHFQVTGVDASGAMLSLARRLNPEVAHVLADMRTVRLRRTFDAVLIADAIDYMLTAADLRAALETAFVHLKPGGVLFTYAEETKERFRRNETRCSTHARRDVEITFVENYYDPDPADTTYDMTFIYLIRRGGRLEIEVDRHLGGVFGLDVWLGLLQEVGFAVQREEVEGFDSPAFVGLKPA